MELVEYPQFNNVSEHNVLTRSSCTELPKRLDHPRKDLINTQNTDGNECFSWCLIRYFTPVDKNPLRIRKVNREFVKQLNF